MDRSTSSAQTNSMSGEAYTPAQVAEIRTDLETIMNAHLDIADDKVAELLQFFNKSVNTILSGATCDPRAIDKILVDRFHMLVCPDCNALFWRAYLIACLTCSSRLFVSSAAR
jgi:hypothetical protein